MHLTTLDTAQQQLLVSCLDPLLAYANERLGIVGAAGPDLRPADTLLRRELVARALWQHLGLIDDYLAERAATLNQGQLGVLDELKGTLYDEFLFGGWEGGRATVLHDTGVYRAIGCDETTSAQLPDRPSLVRMALAPFQGRIVMLLPFVVVGEANGAQRDALLDRAARQGARTPTGAGTVLRKRAKAWQSHKQECRRREDEQAAHETGPAEGFHCGALAGLAGTERQRAIAARRDLIARSSESYPLILQARSVDAHFFPFSLAEGLALLDDEWLESIAQNLGDTPDSASLSRKQLIELLCEQVTNGHEQRDNALMWCEDEQFKLLRTLVHENPLALHHRSPSEVLGWYPMPPYVFILHENESFVAWMPPEVRRIMADVDLDQVAQARERLAEAAHAADALASMCGVVTMDEAWERYRALARDPLDRTHFELALIELETCETRDSYALWSHEGTSYLVSGELSEQGAIARVVRTSYQDQVLEAPQIMGQPKGPAAFLCADEDEFKDRLDAMVAQFEQQRLMLLQLHEHEGLPVHALSPAMLRQGFVDALLETAALARVRDYVDRHLPDDQDEYEFADSFARALVVSALFEHESYHEALDVIRLFGMVGCDGNAYPHTLGRLVTDVFNALPCWQLNGWSLAENTERLTGRPAPLQAAREPQEAPRA